MSLPKTHYAYPHNPELEVVMRMSAVKRWHMIDTTRTQNLAEHTANVALLSWLIAHSAPTIFFNPTQVLLSAMVHDLGEAFLGDTPTHSKALIGKDLINRIESSILPAVYSAQIAEKDSPEAQLLKMCDLADGIRFVRLHGVDMTATHAQEGLEQQLSRLFTITAGEWPDEVWEFVYSNIVFYAYETDQARSRITEIHSHGDARRVDNDVARESLSEPGSPGLVVRYADGEPRNGVVGAEGVWYTGLDDLGPTGR